TVPALAESDITAGDLLPGVLKIRATRNEPSLVGKGSGSRMCLHVTGPRTFCRHEGPDVFGKPSLAFFPGLVHNAAQGRGIVGIARPLLSGIGPEKEALSP